MATQLERVEALLAAQEAAVRRAFREFIRNVNDPAVLRRIGDFLEAGRPEEAMRIVDSYVERMASVIPQIQNIVGTATAAELAATAGEQILAIGFDPSHPRAAQLARANRLQFIRDFTTEQRTATRLAIAEGFTRGTGTRQTARSFRESIGLNSQQVQWLANYERRLRALDPRSLGMDLRDRRFDKTVRRAIEAGRELTPKQIESMTERYRARALTYRAETIARTEALRATSEAREESLEQMIEQTGMDRRRVVRVWHATLDKRTRDFHASMNNQQVGLNEKFTDGNGNKLRYPGDPAAPASSTVNCRCTTTTFFKPPSQEFS